MATISKITAHETLDSRGNPTVEAIVFLDNGVTGYASVPSGASTGSHEAVELRDGDYKRYRGLGVLKACKNVETVITPALIGKDPREQRAIDEIMIKLDGSENKKYIGANAILAVSLACTRAASKSENKPLFRYLKEIYGLIPEPTLPVPMLNLVDCGKHAMSGAEVQEFLLLPKVKDAQGVFSMSDSLRAAAEIFFVLRNILKTHYGYSVSMGDEGGFAPAVRNSEEVLRIMMEAIESAGWKANENIFLGLDPASSEFFDSTKKKYTFERKELFPDAMIAIYEDWFKKYPIISLEDGLAEDDWDNWQALTRHWGQKIQLVGDDLFTTNVKRLQKGVESGVGNAILIKLNQIGTLSETIDCIALARKNHYNVVVSHRSGETNDPFIADLAVAVNAEYIKTGAPSRGERVAKYNRLIEIEQELKGLRQEIYQ